MWADFFPFEDKLMMQQKLFLSNFYTVLLFQVSLSFSLTYIA